jgi:uncharacterized protein (TIGR03083 family)
MTDPLLGAAAPSGASALDHLAELATLQALFARSIDEVDPIARVRWCGRWRVTDLVVHLARIHHWAAGQARRTPETPLGRGPFDLPELYRTCADELLTTLTELGPDAVSSTLDGRGPASFWHRRQLHETLVHVWDLRTAGGLDLDVAPGVWADTVDEVVTVMQPRQVRLGRMAALSAPIELVADDVDRRWLLGEESGRDPTGSVGGPAAELALLLWRRTGADPSVGPDTKPDGRAMARPAQVRVDGDRGALTEALMQRLTP